MKKIKKQRKSSKTRKPILQKVYTPKTTQDVIKYLFKDVDNKTGIFKITDDEYSICMEYTDISFAKSNDEDAESIFLKWLEFLHSFREDTHIEVVNAGSPIKTERYKEQFIFDNKGQISEIEKKIIDELNTLIINALGTNEETLQTKRFVVISLKAKSFIEANSLFLNICIKTEQKFKELKSKVNVVSVKERLSFIHNYLPTTTLAAREIL